VPLPPLLEVFVFWHPDDDEGAFVAQSLHARFHGPAFAGLAGGAVEVYVRSAGWARPGAPPRPLPTGSAAPGIRDVPPAEFTVVVPVLGVGLARAVQDDPEWAAYAAATTAAGPGRLVLPVRVGRPNLAGSALERMLGAVQAIAIEGPNDADGLGRDAAQGMAQWLLADDGAGPSRTTVFVSHTKRSSPAESAGDGPMLHDLVRDELSGTRLADFFDARDLQPGEDWPQRLDAAAADAALLMIRTDLYSRREWTQREVIKAKRADVPAVVLHALRSGDDRGSFLMDHVPAVPCDLVRPRAGVRAALSRLVDEVLKKALWSRQTVYLRADGFDWLPARSPEPVTLTPWLAAHRVQDPEDPHVWIMHPDPPLGPNEREAIDELCSLAGYDGAVDVLTPRTFAARGGRIRP